MDRFSKLLIAKYSPKNGCNVPEGEVLTVVPSKNVSFKNDKVHRFVSCQDKSVRSKFGWVADVQAFTLEEFVNRYLGGKQVGEVEESHIRIMLSDIAHLSSGTAVAATYFVRGDIDRRIDFKVHKVFFYHPKPNGPTQEMKKANDE